MLQVGSARGCLGMRRTILILSLIALAGGVLAFAPQASAIPAFARLYKKSCGTCHVVFPKLSADGEGFRLSGYRRIKGKEITPKIPPVKIGEFLELPGILPLSILIEAGFDFHEVREREAGKSTTTSRNSFNLEEVEVMAAGILGRNVSFFLGSPLAETEFEEGDFTLEGPEAPEQAFVTFNDIVMRDLFNIKVGALELPLAFSPFARRLSVAEYEIYGVDASELLGLSSTEAGLSDEEKGLRLIKPQLGVELYGGASSELTGISNLTLRYHVGTSNFSNRQTDNNRDKGIYGRLSMTFLDQTVGLFGLYAGNLADQDPPGDFGGKNSAWRLGPDINLNLFHYDLNLFAQFRYGRDSNPTGFGEALHFGGGFVEADYLVLPGLIGYARFDYGFASKFDDTGRGGETRTEPRIFAGTGGVQYLIWKNVKILAEYTFREEKERLGRTESTREHDLVREHVFTIRLAAAF